ncbi:MAG: nitroreductase family protein [Chloroflexota bacterium]|nr:nitroreductase family protein [Chloroflexota bacterium]
MPNLDPADLVAFLRSLRAIREFRPDPIPQQVVDDILEVGRWSGSAVNRQPWEFVVIRSRGTLDALAGIDGSAGHLAGASLGIVLVMAGKNVTQETYDEGRLSERMMLAAAAHGVGSSIGWFRSSGAERVKDLLGISAERTVRTALSFGYPDEAARSARPKRDQARKPLAQLVHDERYA